MGIKTRNLVINAVFVAVLSIMSQIAIPMPSGMPLTLQTFAVALIGYALGVKSGVVVILVFIALGAIGLPVFASFMGGVGKLVSLTGGFIFGFIPMAFFCGLGAKKQMLISILLGLIGLILCHALGALQFAAVTQRTYFESFLIASVPYLLKDALSVILAAFLARTLLKRLYASS